MTNDLTNEIKKMNKLLVLIFTKDMSQTNAISFLSKSGFQPKEIADLLGTTSNTVSVVLNKLKKNGKKKP